MLSADNAHISGFRFPVEAQVAMMQKLPLLFFFFFFFLREREWSFFFFFFPFVNRSEASVCKIQMRFALFSHVVNWN